VFFMNEKNANKNKKKVHGIKKGRIPPSLRAAEQLEKERIKEEKERIKAEKMAKKYGEKHGNVATDNLEKSDAERSESKSKETKKEKDKEEKSLKKTEEE